MKKTQNKFIFDVDGTLTASRQLIDPVFAAWFKIFCGVNEVYVVIGLYDASTINHIVQSLIKSNS